jgi:hypothetical protein
MQSFYKYFWIRFVLPMQDKRNGVPVERERLFGGLETKTAHLDGAPTGHMRLLRVPGDYKSKPD